MHEFFAWIVDNKTAIIAGAVIVLKWIYNALPAAGQPFVFSNFFRLFIGEIVQEAPSDEHKVALARKGPNDESAKP